MKVYVVVEDSKLYDEGDYGYEYEPETVIGVYTSKEAADAHCFNNDYTITELELEDK